VFAFGTAQIRRIVTVISCIIFVVGHLWQWGQVRNLCVISFPWFLWRLESFCQEAYGVSPRFAGRRLRWSSRAGRCWLIDSIISWRSWRHSRCISRGWLLAWQLRRREHLGPTITTLVQVISWPRWPITSVNNRSKFPVRFRVRFRPGTGPLQRVSTQNPLLKSQHFLLQLSIWVLIISWHNLYMKYALWCPLSSPVLRFPIGPIVIESRWKPGPFGEIFGLISQRLNEYWSDRKSENGRWNRASIWTVHV